MSAYKFNGTELRSKSGSKIGVLDGKNVRDASGKKIGEIDGKYFRDSSLKKIAEFDGKDIRDGQFRKIGSYDDALKEIEGKEFKEILVVAMWFFFVHLQEG
jgi:hypothetical protein